jgi:hypothetical protein
MAQLIALSVARELLTALREIDEILQVALAWGYAPAELIALAQSLCRRELALVWRLAPVRR